jgi:predicted alpha/beta-fold hydrolase
MFAAAADSSYPFFSSAAADDFRRAPWLFNRHLETILPALSRGRILYKRELAQTPDGDVVAFDFLYGRKNAPAAVIFHGLEGDSQSFSVRALAGFFHQHLGWSVAAANFRTCGGVDNRRPRAYHAGDVDEIDWMCRYVRERFSASRPPRVFAIGVSLGGNALAKWLGENPSQDAIDAAAVICAPLNLAAAAAAIDRGANRLLYAAYFLRTLKAKARAKIARFSLPICPAQLGRAATLREFDSLVTAPLHGFRDADDYWRQASAGFVIGRIKTPLLCVNAANDPLVPAASLPVRGGSGVVFCRPRFGGHAGFVGIPRGWAAARIAGFLTENG